MALHQHFHQSQPLSVAEQVEQDLLILKIMDSMEVQAAAAVSIPVL